MDFFKISLEIFRKTLEIFRQTSEFLGRGGGENSPQVGQRWENRWKDARPSGASFTPIWCNLSHPSSAAFTLIWCNFHAHLVQPSPEGGAYK